MKRIFYIIIAFMSVLYIGCKEEGRIDHIDDSGVAPAQIDRATIQVRPTPGGAVLRYTPPADLMYVRAEYEIQPGVIREIKASHYVDSLALEGFGEVKTYDVRLYSVGKNEKASEPVTVQVIPLKAPVHLASVELQNGFGGVRVKIENPQKATLAIELMGDTAQLGYQTRLTTFYTSLERASLNFRGLDTIPVNFSVYLRDRWNNRSDTLKARMTPMYEEIIPKNTWQEKRFDNEKWVVASSNASIYRMPNIWDGRTYVIYEGFNTDPLPMPFWFSWDLGQTIVMSRFAIWHNPPAEWQAGNMRKFELWGSLQPAQDGSFDSWIPLGKFECVKPSGWDNPAVTAEDLAFGRAGIGFDLEQTEFAPNPFQPVRYLRIVHLESCDGPAAVDKVLLHEFTCWGTIIK